MNDRMASLLGTPKPGLSRLLQPVYQCPAAFPTHLPRALLGHLRGAPCLPSAPLTRRQASGTSRKSSGNPSPGDGAAGGGRGGGSRRCPPRWLRKGLGERGAQSDTGWAQGRLPPRPLTQLFCSTWKVGVQRILGPQCPRSWASEKPRRAQCHYSGWVRSRARASKQLSIPDAPRFPAELRASEPGPCSSGRGPGASASPGARGSCSTSSADRGQ